MTPQIQKLVEEAAEKCHDDYFNGGDIQDVGKAFLAGAKFLDEIYLKQGGWKSLTEEQIDSMVQKYEIMREAMLAKNKKLVDRIKELETELGERNKAEIWASTNVVLMGDKYR